MALTTLQAYIFIMKNPRSPCVLAVAASAPSALGNPCFHDRPPGVCSEAVNYSSANKVYHRRETPIACE